MRAVAAAVEARAKAGMDWVAAAVQASVAAVASVADVAEAEVATAMATSLAEGQEDSAAAVAVVAASSPEARSNHPALAQMRDKSPVDAQSSGCPPTARGSHPSCCGTL